MFALSLNSDKAVQKTARCTFLKHIYTAGTKKILIDWTGFHLRYRQLHYLLWFFFRKKILSVASHCSNCQRKNKLQIMQFHLHWKGFEYYYTLHRVLKLDNRNNHRQKRMLNIHIFPQFTLLISWNLPNMTWSKNNLLISRMSLNSVVLSDKKTLRINAHIVHGSTSYRFGLPSCNDFCSISCT